MMDIFEIIPLMLYTWLVVWACRRVTEEFLQREHNQVMELKCKSLELTQVKKKLQEERRRLAEEETRIFMLYDLTREMTKNFSEEQTFQTFRSTLSQHSSFKDCLLLDPHSEAGIKEKEGQGYSLFPLSSQRLNVGILALRGVQPEHLEKVTILANQFALALRRVRLYQEIERLAITDSLTEAHTRRYLLERFEEERLRAQARKTQMSFLMIDIDFFKTYNDKFGHLTGDLLLREIALIIKTQIREIDIFGRYGGEEFCVVLPDTDLSGAGYVAERIRSAVEQAVIKAYDTTTHASVSIGLALYPSDGKTVPELIDKADWALYRAKKEGRNRVCAFGVYENDKKTGNGF